MDRTGLYIIVFIILGLTILNRCDMDTISWKIDRIHNYTVTEKYYEKFGYH